MVKKKSKVYAIKKGYCIETKSEINNILLDNWEEAKKYVIGINKTETGVSVEYKSFTTKELALEYLNTKPYLIKGQDELPEDALYCYVDGSCSDEEQNYSFGIVAVKDNKVFQRDLGAGTNQEAFEQRQICGELTASMRSMILAKKFKQKHLLILFDYKGVANHATGYWKRDTSISKIYYEWCQKFFKENPDIKVEFVKVDAHTGDDFNELADGQAKKALNIQPNSIYFKILKKHDLEDIGV